MKLLSWATSMLTVVSFFLGFWGLHYMSVDFSWHGLMISLAIACLFWMLAALLYKVCEWAAWKDQENERQRRAVRRYKERQKGGNNDAA